MWRPPGSVCPTTKQLFEFSRISIQHLLPQALSHHEFRKERISGNEFYFRTLYIF